MELIKRMTKGGYIRTASGKFGIIESFTEKDVTFLAINGETITLSRGAAFKSTPQEHKAAIKKLEADDAALTAKLEQAKADDAKKAAKALTPEAQARRAAAERRAEEQLSGIKPTPKPIKREPKALTKADDKKWPFPKQGEVSIDAGDLPAPVEGDAPTEEKPASIIRKDYKEVYVSTKSAAGHSSKICGDRISQMLQGKDLDGAAKEIAKHTGWDAAELLGRYSHLNPGQIRMNIGNRFRAWARDNAPEFLDSDDADE